RRLLEPLAVRVVREDERAALQRVDHRARDLLPYRRATPAAADAADAFCDGLAHVGRTVHDDGPRECIVVEARVEAAQAQRVAVAAVIRFGRLEQAETRHLAALDVGEPLGELFPCVAA